MQNELNWKNLYDELRNKVDSYKVLPEQNDSYSDNITSPLRVELETQTEKIRLKNENLDLYTSLNECKEKIQTTQKMLKKKDSQITQLKDLLSESDKLREEMLEKK